MSLLQSIPVLSAPDSPSLSLTLYVCTSIQYFSILCGFDDDLFPYAYMWIFHFFDNKEGIIGLLAINVTVSLNKL